MASGKNRHFFAAAIFSVVALGSSLAWLARGHTSSELSIRGRLLEACSCSVPCACNFGGNPSPHDFCDSLAFFEIESGEIEHVDLKGLKFAIAERGGVRAVVYIDSSVSTGEANALQRIAAWILSLEGTRGIGLYKGSIVIDFDEKAMRGEILGTGTSLRAVALTGNDGKASMIVTRPRIFGSFPVVSAVKGVAQGLAVRGTQMSFNYANTNANSGVFEILPGQVK